MNEHEIRIRKILEDSFINEYIQDENITDISFNGTKMTLQHNQKGRFTAEVQPDIVEVRRLAKKIADVQRKEFTNSEPIMDTEIGFLRVNTVHDAVSPDGMTFAIRVSRPRLAVTSVTELTIGKSQDVEDLLKVLILAGSNIIISGRTGAGKTELQKLLVGYIPDDQKITLIEDTRDSHIKALYPNKDINSWQTLLSAEREKPITIQVLVKAGLRNNPDWVLVSETRGSEAADMLDSAKTDHSIITTIHAKGAINIPSRLIPMIRSSPSYSVMNDQLVGREIVEFLRFGIHIQAYMENGSIVRRIKEIMEYTEFDNGGVTGRYLYQSANVYDEETNTYSAEELFTPLSKQTIDVIKDRQLFHMLPNLYRDSTKEGVVRKVD